MNNLNELNGREMQTRLEKAGIRAQKVVKRRYTGHYTAEFYTPTLDSAVPPAREMARRIESGLGSMVQILEARDTCADWRPGKPIIAASVTFAVLDKAPVKPAAIEVQHAESAPDMPASVDRYLFGKDVDVKRLQAHELHDADGAPVEDKDARIRQLEAIIANHSASLLQEAHKSEQLQALLSEAVQVLAPLAAYWRTTKDFNTGDIRLDAVCDIAEFVAKLDAALKK